MVTMTVKDAEGDTETVEKPLAPNRAAAIASRPVVLSQEDYDALRPKVVTVQVTVQRPNNSVQYTADDAWAASTPAALVFTNVVSANGKSGAIIGCNVVSNARQATPLMGEFWFFNAAPAAIVDADPFTLTDTEIRTAVAKIPFSLDSAGNNTLGTLGNIAAFLDSLFKPFTCGAATRNLWALPKVINAYTPVIDEQLTATIVVSEIG